MPKITLNFEDGVTRIIENLPHETVAEAAYRNRLNIPLDCADGACGTCKCLCVSGSYDPGDYIDEALTEDEAGKGFGLACQMRPESDLVIAVLASSTVCKVEVLSYKCEIKEVDRLSDEIVKLKLKPENPIGFLSGQYVNIEIPDSGKTRSYSFSSSPDTDDLEFIIRLVEDGLMSNFLREKVQVGQSLNIKGPLGSFYNRELVRPTLLFAGGTGIAPFISMLANFAATQTKQPLLLFYGASSEDNLVELPRLEAFKDTLNLTIYVCDSSGKSGVYPSGYVTQWINRTVLIESDYDVYICGPDRMVDAIRNALSEEQVHSSNFYTEKFLPSGEASLVQ